jgi:hypothetical protein
VLKDLKDRHLIGVRDGSYSVRTANLDTIKSELDGKTSTSDNRRRKRAKAQSHSDGPDAADGEASQAREPRKSSTHKKGTIAGTFDGWIDAGFFDEPRSLADVQKRFAKEGIILPQTSIPIYLLKAVRRGRLSRDETDVGGRTVWVYQKQ